MFGAFTLMVVAKTSAPFNGVPSEERSDIVERPIDLFTVGKDVLSLPDCLETLSLLLRDSNDAFYGK